MMLRRSEKELWERLSVLETSTEGHWRLNEEQFRTLREEVERLNGIRKALEDQAKRTEETMLPRREYEVAHQTLATESDALREEVRRGVLAQAKEFAQMRTDLSADTAAVRAMVLEQATRFQEQITAVPEARNERDIQHRWMRVSGWIAAAGVAITLFMGIVYIAAVVLTGR